MSIELRICGWLELDSLEVDDRPFRNWLSRLYIIYFDLLSILRKDWRNWMSRVSRVRLSRALSVLSSLDKTRISRTFEYKKWCKNFLCQISNVLIVLQCEQWPDPKWPGLEKPDLTPECMYTYKNLRTSSFVVWWRPFTDQISKSGWHLNN